MPIIWAVLAIVDTPERSAETWRPSNFPGLLLHNISERGLDTRYRGELTIVGDEVGCDPPDLLEHIVSEGWELIRVHETSDQDRGQYRVF